MEIKVKCSTFSNELFNMTSIEGGFNKTVLLLIGAIIKTFRASNIIQYFSCHCHNVAKEITLKCSIFSIGLFNTTQYITFKPVCNVNGYLWYF